MATKAKKKNWISSLFSSTPKIFIQKTNNIEEPKSTRGQKIWVLARSVCIHRHFPLPQNVKGKKRFNLISLQMHTASPFTNTASFSHWTKTGVSIWFWNQDEVNKKMAEYNLSPKTTIVYPETALIDPLQSGMRLIECLEGYEGQIWDQHQLITSRWWDHYPDDQEWLQFWRSAGQISTLYAQDKPSSAKEAIIDTKSWAHTRPIAGGFTTESLYSREAIAVLALILILPLSFYGGQILNDYLTLEEIEQNILALESQTKKIDIERKKAEANNDKIKKLLAFDAYPSPITLLAKIVEKIESPTLKIIEFKFNSATINMVLHDETPPDAVSFLALMEKIPYFEQPNAEPGFARNTIRVTLKVKKLWM
ncbi:MAG: hypothetical protein Q8L85_10550 [Alphaproteobacteria bacterium]|nr:hypothetical protein [Alphaproteobacteria bacterium]MDP3532029.1 hypothetical protein [Alphaproteobacteria bacterium]